MIAGLETISAGEIAIAGQVVNDLEPRERGCAMVFQNYALYPHMTVAENIGYALKVAGSAATNAAPACRGRGQRRPLPISLTAARATLRGQRQRVAMARASSAIPRWFLFDEPLSNLDAKLRVQMRTKSAASTTASARQACS